MPKKQQRLLLLSQQPESILFAIICSGRSLHRHWFFSRLAHRIRADLHQLNLESCSDPVEALQSEPNHGRSAGDPPSRYYFERVSGDDESSTSSNSRSISSDGWDQPSDEVALEVGANLKLSKSSPIILHKQRTNACLRLLSRRSFYSRVGELGFGSIGESHELNAARSDKHAAELSTRLSAIEDSLSLRDAEQGKPDLIQNEEKSFVRDSSSPTTTHMEEVTSTFLATTRVLDRAVPFHGKALNEHDAHSSRCTAEVSTYHRIWSPL
eukprot:6348900-Amphidinium_carterae.1